MQRRQSFAIIVAAVLFATPAAQAKDVKKGTDVPAINVDVPVKLSSASIVFNLDHLAFSGDMPIGIKYMDLQVDAGCGRSKWTLEVDARSGRSMWTLDVDARSGRSKWTLEVDARCGRCKWTL